MFGLHMNSHRGCSVGGELTLSAPPPPIIQAIQHFLDGISHLFVSISSDKRHSCVRVDHPRSVVVPSLAVLSVVVRFLVVSVLQGHGPLLSTTNITSAVP